jgi:hypothetical protein
VQHQDAAKELFDTEAIDATIQLLVSKQFRSRSKVWKEWLTVIAFWSILIVAFLIVAKWIFYVL